MSNSALLLRHAFFTLISMVFVFALSSGLISFSNSTLGSV